jgi:hypothetical protein
MDYESLTDAVVESIAKDAVVIDWNKTYIDNGGYSLAAVRLVDLVYPITGKVLNFLELMSEKPLRLVFQELCDDAAVAAAQPAELEEGSI